MAKLSQNVAMNKEKVITIIIGLLVGAAIAGGYFYWTKVASKGTPPSQSMSQTKEQPKNETQGKSDMSKNEGPLTLSSPEDNSSTAETTISVKGKAPANAKVIFYANADEKIASASADGTFETTVKLETGLNVISVTAIDGSGTMYTVLRNVTMEASQ